LYPLNDWTQSHNHKLMGQKSLGSEIAHGDLTIKRLDRKWKMCMFESAGLPSWTGTNRLLVSGC
jgi:hypothetical protein